MIDGFSKFAYTVPLKTKTAVEVASALDDVLSNIPHSYTFFGSDRGSGKTILVIFCVRISFSEFLVINKELKRVLETKHRLHTFTLKGDIKSSIIERFNRTLKERIARYLTEKKNKIWIDALSSITNNYNHTVHSTTGFAPANVNFENAKQIRMKMYGKKIEKQCKLKKGDIVRLAVNKNIFAKGYDANWSKETYTISKIESSFGNCWYKGE